MSTPVVLNIEVPLELKSFHWVLLLLIDAGLKLHVLQLTKAPSIVNFKFPARALILLEAMTINFNVPVVRSSFITFTLILLVPCEFLQLVFFYFFHFLDAN
jgi:hypothetical protein